MEVTTSSRGYNISVAAAAAALLDLQCVESGKGQLNNAPMFVVLLVELVDSFR